MKKTPIIAGLIGLGVVGGAYLGALYYSGNKATSAIRQSVDMFNKSSIVDYVEIEEDRGLFSSDVHVIAKSPMAKVFDPSQSSAAIADAKLTLHHGIFSTDVDGKFMLNATSWKELEVIRKNEGLDISAHINTFNEMGNFVQAKIDVPPAKENTSSTNNVTVRIRIEPQAVFDQGTQDKLKTIIAKGINEQAPIKSDGKEHRYILKAGVLGTNKTFDIEMPILYQENSNATDVATTVLLKVDGQDSLKASGIDEINGVSHITRDEHLKGSYALLRIPHIKAPDERQPQGTLSDITFQTGINDKQTYFTARIGSVDAHDADSHIVMGPASISMFSDIQTEDRLKALAESLRSNNLSQQERQDIFKKLITYMPDVHAELHDVAFTTAYNENKSLKSATLDITRDINTPVTHVGVELHDINGDITHGHFSQHVSVDQSIIDTVMSVGQAVNVARFVPSMDPTDIAQKELFALIKSSPRVVLNDFSFSADEFPRELKASGEAVVQGDAITRLEDFDEKYVNAHFVVTGLPDELEELFEEKGLVSIENDQPINIDLKSGHIWVNGEKLD